MSHDRPNIVDVWGDDIGQMSLSCYSRGVMGYRTPNIDRRADEDPRRSSGTKRTICSACIRMQPVRE